MVILCDSLSAGSYAIPYLFSTFLYCKDSGLEPEIVYGNSWTLRYPGNLELPKKPALTVFIKKQLEQLGFRNCSGS